MSASRPDDPPPSARVLPARRSWAWVLPALALGLAVFLLVQALGGTGIVITVRAEEGHGVQEGAVLRYRGIDVGRVQEVRLARDLSDVVLEVRLQAGARALARAGSRFWIVRPQITLDSLQGVETVVGARYLAVLPGPPDARRQTEFVALRDPPVVARMEPGGLEITLEAPERFSLAPGAPVQYRQIEVGRVLSVGLSSDATAVEVRAYVRPAFVQLVRERTRFFEVGGVEVKLTLMGGLKVDMESIRSLLVGGVALATPPDPGGVVSTGHRFVLHAEPEEEWLAWEPALPVGSALLPLGTRLPPALRARLAWERGRLLKRESERHGWVVPVSGGLLGPADLLERDSDAAEDSTRFAVAGETFALKDPPTWVAHGLARVDLPLALEERWDVAQGRRLEAPEDCLVFGDPATPPRALSATRLTGAGDGAGDGVWEVDPALAFDADWHGGRVVARGDGKLVGVLIVERELVRVAPLPAE